MRTVLAALVLSLPAAALAEDEKQERESGSEPRRNELAVDVGTERTEGEFAPTIGLLFAMPFTPSDRFVASAALVDAHGTVSGGDVAVGYYHSWDVLEFEPELGIEVGAEAEDGIHPFGRIGAGLFHPFGGHYFAGLALDASLRNDLHVLTRALFEIGTQL